MDKIKFVEVLNDEMIIEVEQLANSIWYEYYAPMIGSRQVEYMLEKFQSKKAITRQINMEGYLYYLIERDICGFIGYFAVLPRLQSAELILSKIYIQSNDRQRGYGGITMRFIEGIANQTGLAKITLTVNKNNVDSIAAYQKMGFEIAGSMVTEIGGGFVMDDYKMEKELM